MELDDARRRHSKEAGMRNMLKPSIARIGDVRVGSKVDVRYRTEADQWVATRVTVEQRAL
jgi:hypothetical protein